MSLSKAWYEASANLLTSAMASATLRADRCTGRGERESEQKKIAILWTALINCKAFKCYTYMMAVMCAHTWIAMHVHSVLEVHVRMQQVLHAYSMQYTIFSNALHCTLKHWDDIIHAHAVHCTRCRVQVVLTWRVEIFTWAVAVMMIVWDFHISCGVHHKHMYQLMFGQ